ncbi:enoyl-CoA hydratase/isomerase family protein [Mycolicibacterium wolinskyi]|uniref:Probable enoyl-CoA hydratase EchA17 n=1 Tax=Mycolicibacterium wolinskyi TaxID=59750 RepID=A0A1X2F0A6_9MYCO|nr:MULTISPECIES: enoyl-CoA hydratase/isomerase family protein [Mycolicibacterium]MCV7288677.1 enoyl-CoA hydratase/isomerase family protein [Mycolicibacterium wolinskyi]MCV7295899.1 enoyl-CoA hydratase/isomerase family protein [Mycolicibacterium goodii]ORX11881.1 crotonase [Mycolicibacterium wolinskyi]
MSAENTGTVEVHREDTVAVVTLRRERKRNALSTHMESELLRALRSPEVESSRAIVITGGDTVFSAGADVTELREMTPHAIADYYRGSGSVYEMFAGLPQPTIAAITGYCLGGGLELALAADIRIADPAAIFGFPEIGIGILPSSGGVTRMVRVVGAGRTRDLVLRGRRFDAGQAELWGIVSEVTAPGEHIKKAIEIARELAERPPLALRITKQVLDVSLDAPTQAALLLEQLAYAVLNNAPEKDED